MLLQINNDLETVEIIKKLETIIDKIIQDLNKKSSESTHDHVTIMKTYHGRLVQCTSEIELVFRRLNQNDLGSLFTGVVECFTNIHQKLVTNIEKPKLKLAEIPLEYATQRKAKFSTEEIQKQDSEALRTQEQFSRYTHLSRGDIFTLDSQKKNSTVFGGFEVFTETSTQQAFLSGVQSPVSSKGFGINNNVKKKVMRNVRTVATDTNEDMKTMMSGIFLSEKQIELQMIEDMNEMNRMEIDRALKLKFVWKDLVPSGASDKISDMHKQMNKIGFQQSQFINEQEYLQALQGNSQLSEYFKIQQELLGAIHLVQDKTAKRILKMANEKLRDFLRNSMKDALKKQKKQKSDVKKQKTVTKADLEQALNQRIQELQNKDTQINQLLMRYETNERRLNELLNQLQSYKDKIEIIEAQNEEFFSVQKDGNNFDIGIQVSIPDAFLNALQEQLQHQIESTEHTKYVLQELQEQNRLIIMRENFNSNIHKAMELLMGVDQKAKIQVQGMGGLLDLLKNGNPEEVALQSPDEILHQIMTRIQFNLRKKLEAPTQSVADSKDNRQSESQLKNNRKGSMIIMDVDSRKGDQGSSSPIKRQSSIMDPVSSRVNTANRTQKELQKIGGRSSSMRFPNQNNEGPQQKLDQMFNPEKQQAKDQKNQSRLNKGRSENSQKIPNESQLGQDEEGNLEDQRAQVNTRQLNRKLTSRDDKEKSLQVVAGQATRFSGLEIDNNQSRQYALISNNLQSHLLDIEDEGRFQTRTTERNLLDSDFIQKFKQQNFQGQQEDKDSFQQQVRKKQNQKKYKQKQKNLDNDNNGQQNNKQNDEVSNNQNEFNSSYQINDQSLYVIDKEIQTNSTQFETQETQTDLYLLQDLYLKLQKEKYFNSNGRDKDDLISSDRVSLNDQKNDKTSFLSIVRNKQDQSNNRRILIDSHSKKSVNDDSKQKLINNDNIIDLQEFGFQPDNIVDENNFEEQVLKDLGLKEFDLLPDKDILKNKNIIKKLYERFQQTSQSEWNRQLTIKITKYLSLKEQNGINFEAFLVFISKYVSVHKQCGDFCIHLKRFFNKFGFTSKYWNKRRILNPSKQQPNPFASTVSQMTQSLSMSTPKGFSQTQFLFRK